MHLISKIKKYNYNKLINLSKQVDQIHKNITQNNNFTATLHIKQEFKNPTQ